MPLYDFKCKKCGYIQTHKYSPSRDIMPDKIFFGHPDCKNRILTRMYSVPSLLGLRRFGTRSKHDTGTDRKPWRGGWE